jgi:hypothetical protein
MSLTHGYSLMFSSVKSQQLLAQIRSVFQNLFFCESLSSLNLNISHKDHIKPLFTVSGLDNINAMNLLHRGSLSMEVAMKKDIAGLVPIKQ